MRLHELFQINIYHGYMIQIYIAELMYVRIMKPREHFKKRIMLGTVMYCMMAVVLPNLIAHFVSGFFSLIIFVLSVLVWIWCYRNQVKEILFCCVGAQFTQNLSYNIENLIYNPLRSYWNNIIWFILSVGVMVFVYGICYFFFARRLDKVEEVNVNGAGIFSLAIVTALFIYVVQFLFGQYQIDTIWVTRLPLIFCCVLGLCMQFCLLDLGEKNAENMLLERMLEREGKQYEMTQNSINLINMKAHDLKHQVARYRALGKIDSEELRELDEVVESYEMTSNTGNIALDIVLSEKKILCARYEISFHIVVDGQALEMMAQTDIASVFGNALDNAIEHERKISEVAKRSIVLNVFQKGNLVYIRIENYCPEAIKMEDKLPVTTKKNSDYHGFGLKSIQYIVKKYGGNTTVKVHNNMFALNIIIPSKCLSIKQ